MYGNQYNNNFAYNNQIYEEDDDDATEELLQHEQPPDWEPTTEDILRYAEFLGIDPITDSEYIYLAKEGIMMPQPPPWQRFTDERQQQLLYVNCQNEDISYVHPNAEEVKLHFEKIKKNKTKRNKSNKNNAMKKLIGRNLAIPDNADNSESQNEDEDPKENKKVNKSQSRSNERNKQSKKRTGNRLTAALQAQEEQPTSDKHSSEKKQLSESKKSKNHPLLKTQNYAGNNGVDDASGFDNEQQKQIDFYNNDSKPPSRSKKDNQVEDFFKNNDSDEDELINNVYLPSKKEDFSPQKSNINKKPDAPKKKEPKNLLEVNESENIQKEILGQRTPQQSKKKIVSPTEEKNKKNSNVEYKQAPKNDINWENEQKEEDTESDLLHLNDSKDSFREHSRKDKSNTDPKNIFSPKKRNLEKSSKKKSDQDKGFYKANLSDDIVEDAWEVSDQEVSAKNSELHKTKKSNASSKERSPVIKNLQNSIKSDIRTSNESYNRPELGSSNYNVSNNNSNAFNFNNSITANKRKDMTTSNSSQFNQQKAVTGQMMDSKDFFALMQSEMQSQGKTFVDSIMLNDMVSQISNQRQTVDEFKTDKNESKIIIDEERKKRQQLETTVSALHTESERLKLENIEISATMRETLKSSVVKKEPSSPKILYETGILSGADEIQSEEEDVYIKNKSKRIEPRKKSKKSFEKKDASKVEKRSNSSQNNKEDDLTLSESTDKDIIGQKNNSSKIRSDKSGLSNLRENVQLIKNQLLSGIMSNQNGSIGNMSQLFEAAQNNVDNPSISLANLQKNMPNTSNSQKILEALNSGSQFYNPSMMSNINMNNLKPNSLTHNNSQGNQNPQDQTDESFNKILANNQQINNQYLESLFKKTSSQTQWINTHQPGSILLNSQPQNTQVKNDSFFPDDVEIRKLNAEAQNMVPNSDSEKFVNTNVPVNVNPLDSNFGNQRGLDQFINTAQSMENNYNERGDSNTFAGSYKKKDSSEYKVIPQRYSNENRSSTGKIIESHVSQAPRMMTSQQQESQPVDFNIEVFAEKLQSLIVESSVQSKTGLEAAGRWMNIVLTEKARLTNEKRRLDGEKNQLEKKKYNQKIYELEMHQELQKSNLKSNHPLVKKIGKSIQTQRATVKKDIGNYKDKQKKYNYKEMALKQLEMAMVNCSQSGNQTKGNEEHQKGVYKSYITWEDDLKNTDTMNSDINLSEQDFVSADITDDNSNHGFSSRNKPMIPIKIENPRSTFKRHNNSLDKSDDATDWTDDIAINNNIGFGNNNDDKYDNHTWTDEVKSQRGSRGHKSGRSSDYDNMNKTADNFNNKKKPKKDKADDTFLINDKGPYMTEFKTSFENPIPVDRSFKKQNYINETFNNEPQQIFNTGKSKNLTNSNLQNSDKMGQSSNFWEMVIGDNKFSKVSKQSSKKFDLGVSKMLDNEITNWKKSLREEVQGSTETSKFTRDRDIKTYFNKQNMWYEAMRTEVGNMITSLKDPSIWDSSYSNTRPTSFGVKSNLY